MSDTSIFDDNAVSAASTSIFGGYDGNAAGLTNSMTSILPGAQGINLAQQQQAWNQAIMARQHWAQQQHHWMINGRSMNFEDFLNEVCPESDDPMRTFLILKYKDVK